jgi:methylmalonyl-CoA mutase C-terminal domain/subunit
MTMTTSTATDASIGTVRRQVRVLLAKTGLDGHDRGMKVVAMYLRDAGMDVVFLGIHHTTEEIVRAAIDEDVDVIGLSSLGGTHVAHSRELLERLKAQGLGELPVIVGGTIPVEDIPVLQDLGVRAVLRAGTLREEIVSTVRDLVVGTK